MLRRYRIKKNEYEQVLKWVQAQKHDEQEDEKSAEPLAQVGHTMPASPAEDHLGAQDQAQGASAGARQARTRSARRHHMEAAGA